MINDDQLPGQPEGIDLKGIYYVLFRHKWKVICFCFAGVLASAAMYFLNPPVFQSEGNLLVKYVRDSDARILSPGAKDSEIKIPDSRGDGVMNTEKAILTSFDLALEVADQIGPERILRKAGRTDRILAASVVHKGTLVETKKENNTISVVFRHRNPEVAQAVLRSLFEVYQKKHVAIHALAGINEEELTKKADDLRSKLKKTEEELRGWKEKAGVTSVEDANKSHVDQITKIQEDLHKAETELAGRKAGLRELQGTAPKRTTETVVGVDPVPADKADQFRNLTLELDSLRKTETNLLAQFTGDAPYVKRIRERIAEFEQQKKKLEEDHPQLIKPSAILPLTSNQAAPTMNTSMESYRITTLEAETNTLHFQLESLQAGVAEIRKAEARITELQREKELQEASLRTYQTVLEQAKIYLAFAPGKMPNINVVQEPTPPAKDLSKTVKPMAVALALGLIGGLGLAFLIELVLDLSVKRPIDVKRKLRLPLFLTIPLMPRNGHAHLPKRFEESSEQMPRRTTSVGVDPSSFFPHRTGSPANTKQKSASAKSDGNMTSSAHIAGGVAPWEAHHRLRVYYEALRDRLITHFEVNNMTHKPKLIAVTSCSQGAGVTSTAAGLAATLSETGDGNVLLVDMNLEQGAAHPFHRGKPACGLLDALESETRDPALVQEKLYLASMNDTASKLPNHLPRRFTHLVPKLKMSDYDYIIFDMPAVSQTSITPKLARYMDMVLMVLESEKTNREVVEQATSLLGESNVSVKAVLNKYRPYVPRWLQQEL